jgi:hypothetical protein
VKAVDLSKLDANERMAAFAAAVVLVLGIVSIVNDWGALMIVPILGSLAVLAVLLLPQLNLPVAKGLALVLAGAVAALFWIIATVSWLDWIVGHLATFDTLQFLVGLVASLVLAWAGWQAYQGSTGTTNPSSPA